MYNTNYIVIHFSFDIIFLTRKYVYLTIIVLQITHTLKKSHSIEIKWFLVSIYIKIFLTNILLMKKELFTVTPTSSI